VISVNDLKTKLNPEILAKEPIERIGGLELIITPKKEFLKWYKHIKGINGEVTLKEYKKGLEPMECPNCKYKMGSYEINNDKREIWYLCSTCNLNFSQKQHKYFTTMIMRLINEEYNITKTNTS